MTEKVFKVLIARLEESAVYFQFHQNDVWSKQLDESREALLKAFVEQQKEIERLNKKVEDIYEIYADI